VLQDDDVQLSIVTQSKPASVLKDEKDRLTSVVEAMSHLQLELTA
jgi:hypothetical protein